MHVTTLFRSISHKRTSQAKTTLPLIICHVWKYPQKKLILRIKEDIPTTPIELHVQSAGVSEEEQIFNTEDDDETEEQIFQRKIHQINFLTIHSKNLLHTKAITTNSLHFKNYHT